MTSLQKVVLGTPPTAVDGDTVRVANTKANSNVDVLNAQAALTSATGITAAQALTVAHIGKRVNIALAAAGIVNLPAASTCTADNVLHLRNIGTTVVTLAITTGSGDTVALSKLNPGESVLMDTDGVHTWTVLMRGRTNSDNEVVNGNCAVGGNETIGGTLGVTGATSLAGLAVAGAASFATRPSFGANTPWDSANLIGPTSLVGTYPLVGLSSVTIPLSATYLEHELSIIGMTASAAGNVYVQFSADGGATWVTAAGYYYGFNQLVLGATAPAVGSATGQSNSLITGGMGVGTIAGPNRLDGRISLYGMGLSSTNKQGKISTVAYLSDNLPRTVDGILGFVTAASPLTFNAMKVYVGSGTFTGGTIKLYGKP
jgi:hypothetical protein